MGQRDTARGWTAVGLAAVTLLVIIDNAAKILTQ